MAKRPYQRQENETFRAWIADVLQRSAGRLNQSGLARHMGLDRSQISHILSGKRAIRAGELEVIAAYFGEAPPGTSVMPISSQKFDRVPVIGRLGKAYWHDTSEDYVDGQIDSVEAPADRNHPTVKRQAFILGGASDTEHFARNSVAVALSLDDLRMQLAAGALVITQRTRRASENGKSSTLENWTIAKVASIAADGTYRLTPVLNGETVSDLGRPTHWVRLVIRQFS